MHSTPMFLGRTHATLSDFYSSPVCLWTVIIGLKDYQTFLFRYTEYACSVAFHYFGLSTDESSLKLNSADYSAPSVLKTSLNQSLELILCINW